MKGPSHILATRAPRSNWKALARRLDQRLGEHADAAMFTPDLGLVRTEITSVAAEVTEKAEYTPMRTRLPSHSLAISRDRSQPYQLH